MTVKRRRGELRIRKGQGQISHGAPETPPDRFVEEEPMHDLTAPPVRKAEIEDVVRRNITYILLILLSVVALSGIALVAAHHIALSDMNELLDRIFTPIIALTGTAVGFYFGERRTTRR